MATVHELDNPTPQETLAETLAGMKANEASPDYRNKAHWKNIAKALQLYVACKEN